MSNPLRLLHSSDWHIGMTRRHLSESKQAVFRDARLQAIEQLCDHAREYDVAGVIVAGDVFDGNQLDSNTIISLLEMVGELTCPVVLQPGNHDSYRRDSVYQSPAFRAHQPDNILVPHEPGVLRDIPGLELIVGPYSDRYPTENPLFTALRQYTETPKEPGTYRVGLAHAGVDAFSPHMEDATGAEIIPVTALEEACRSYQLDYLALGDRHSQTPVGESGRIWYSGSPEVTDFDDVEKNSGKALLVTLHDSTCTTEPLTCGKWSFCTIRRDIHSTADIAQLSRDFAAIPNKRRTAVRLGLNATLTVEDMAALDTAQTQWEGMFAGFRLWERHSSRHLLPSLTELRERLTGYVAEAAEELSQLAETGDKTAQDALTLLYRLTAEGDHQ